MDHHSGYCIWSFNTLGTLYINSIFLSRYSFDPIPATLLRYPHSHLRNPPLRFLWISGTYFIFDSTYVNPHITP
jgi:hypothetical protein